MKQKILLTTALVLAIGATNARAEIDIVNLLNNPQFHYTEWDGPYNEIDPNPVNYPVEWKEINATEAQNYNWQDESTPASITIHHEDEFGDLVSSEGAIRVQISDSETKYYSYVYTRPENYEKMSNITISPSTGDVEDGYLYENSGNAINISGQPNSVIKNVDIINSNKGINIYQWKTIKGIKSNFIDNNLGIEVGVSYVNGNGNIQGSFINNNRAIIAHGGSQINFIYSIFVGNHFNGNTEDSGILHFGNMFTREIISVFIDNYAKNDIGAVHGGAIHSYNTTRIGNLESIFISNYTDGNTESLGGALYNAGTIGTTDSQGKAFGITNSEFYWNRAISENGVAKGGAIYNSGTIGRAAINGGIENSNFIENYAKSTSGTAQGGAIWTNKDLNIIADNGISTFQGNYVQEGENVKDYQAIWVDSADATLTFDTKNNGEIFMYDNVNGVEKTTTDKETGEETTTRYKVNITSSEGEGTMHLYNDIKNADVSVSNTTLDIGTSAVNMKNVTFAADSALVLKVNSLDEHGSLTAENITVADGAKLKPTLAQGLVKITEEKQVQLLTATDEASKDFNNFTEVLDNNMYHFEKADKNGAYNISLVETAEEIADATGAEHWIGEAAGAYVDGEKFAEGTVSADVANKLADLAQNNPTGLVEAVKTLAPTETAVVQAQSTEEASRLFKNVDSYLRGEHSPMGFASGDDLDGVSVWGKAYIGESKISRRGTIAGSEADSKGFIIGLEKKLNKEVKVGAGIQYDNTDIDAYRRDMDVDSVMGFVYGEYKPSNWFVNGVLSYGGSNYDEKKYALGTHYDAKYDAHVASAAAMTGYQYGIFTPEAGLRYYHIKQSGYTDTAGQNVEEDKSDILRGVAGVRMAKDFGQFRPEAYLGITYDLSSDKGNTTVNLANGSSYTVQGKRLDKLGYEASLSFAASLNENITASVSYLGAYRDNYREHTGMFNVKYNF